MTAKVFIDGEVGTTGLQIRNRLAGRDDIELIHLDEANRKDTDARRAALVESDVAILCLPDVAAIEAVKLADGQTRIIDASTAHRVNPDWAFGFPEMTTGQRQRIENAQFVSNPGCYSTGAIALLRPLHDAGLLAEGFRPHINAVSGYSGGGKQMIAEMEQSDGGDYFIYGLDQNHKHVPEIVKYAGAQTQPIFVPSVGKFAQGMAVQIPLYLDTLKGQPDMAALNDVFSAHYEGQEFIQICPQDSAVSRVDPQRHNGTNVLEIIIRGDDASGRVVLVAVLDNLGKGASGASVQNLNLMLGLPENAGLK